MEHRRQRQRNLSRAVEEPDFKLLKVHRKLQQSEGSEVTMLRMVQVGETYDLTYSDSDDDWFVWWKRLFHGLCQQLHERRCGALWHRWFEAAGW